MRRPLQSCWATYAGPEGNRQLLPVDRDVEQRRWRGVLGDNHDDSILASLSVHSFWLVSTLALPDHCDERLAGLGFWVGLIMALMAEGCGGSGGSCGNAPACGGSIVGTWTISSACLTAEASFVTSQCAAGTLTSSSLTETGTIIYNSDGTYSSSGTANGYLKFDAPQSCLMSDGGTPPTCQQLNQMLQATASLTPGMSETCTGSSVCHCTLTITNQARSDTGTYTTTATGLLTLTPMNGTASQIDYCVQGHTLTESPQAGSMSSGIVTLTKG